MEFQLHWILYALVPPSLIAGIVVSAIQLKRAMDAESYSVKAWAIDLGYSNHANASRKLTGEKTLTARDIEVMPANVQRWYHLFCLESLGLPPVAQTAAAVHSHLQRRSA